VTDHDNGSGRAVARLFGALLMAAGALIAGLCGLCSVAFLVSLAATDQGGLGGMWVVALIFGGPPIVIGVGVFLGGRSLWRGPKPSKPTAPSA
jgi:hypothetical protein